MDAVGPEVDVMLGREIALAPAHMLLRPHFLEPPDGRGRQPAGVLAEQREQLVTRGWKRLKELATLEGLSILEYPLPEVRERMKKEAE